MKALVLIVFIGLFLYLPALRNTFVWDDEEQVVTNTAVHTVQNIPQLLTGSTFSSGGAESLGGLYYKPLMSICFAVFYTIFGSSPWAFHLFQIGLHLGSACLLYIILRKLWKESAMALITALVFLIHPQNVESVVYISSLQDTLYMFLGMLGLTWIVISDDKISWWDLVFASVCVFLALLSKETGGLFGIIIGVYMFLFARRDLWRWLILMGIVYGSYLCLRIGVAQVGLDKNMFTPIATLPLRARLGNVPGIIWHYLSQFVWPARLAISQHWVNRSPGILQGSVLCVLVLVWVWVLKWSINNKGRILVFFWLWFVLGVAFHSQVFPLDMTVADRWFYLPMVGLLGVGGSLIAKFRSLAYRYARIGTVVAGIILLVMFWRSSVRIQNWRDGLSLYSHDIQIMGESFDLQNNYGVELFRVGRYAEAKQHFEKSTILAPSWWTNWNNLGVSVEHEGNLDLALNYYNKAIQNGYYYLAYANYAKILLRQGKLEEARVFLKDSLRLFPNNFELVELYQYSKYTEGL